MIRNPLYIPFVSYYNGLSYKKRQGGHDVNDVIDKLSDIEQSAVSIMEGANACKKEIAQEMAGKTADFDAQLELETAGKLDKLRAQMEVDMKAKLSKQKSDAEEILRQMENNYKTHHVQYAKELFAAMTEG